MTEKLSRTFASFHTEFTLASLVFKSAVSLFPPLLLPHVNYMIKIK